MSFVRFGRETGWQTDGQVMDWPDERGEFFIHGHCMLHLCRQSIGVSKLALLKRNAGADFKAQILGGGGELGLGLGARGAGH